MEHETDAFRLATDVFATSWLIEGFAHGDEVGNWALPAVFEAYAEVPALELGSEYDDGSGATAPTVAKALIRILANFTETAGDCFFAVWEGYAGLPDAPLGARFKLPPQRDMVLLRGPIESAQASFEVPPTNRRPVRWWPADREWCVGADIYSRELTIGGSVACIAAVLASTKLNARSVSPVTD